MNPLFLLMGFLAMGAGAGGGSSSTPTAGDATPPVPPSGGGDGDGGGSGPGVVVDDVPTPVVVDPDPEAPDQPGTTDPGGSTDPVTVTDTLLEVMGGRVTTIAPDGDDIASIKITSNVEEGKVTVNPDNTLALVMTLSDFSGAQSFSYDITHGDGSVTSHSVDLNVLPSAQAAGWGTGESHYMLALDENDNVIIETGENHTKVYVSGATDALSLADIAAAEGMAVEDVTGKWLADHGGYGQSEEMALAEDAASLMWSTVSPAWSTHSNHLLLESGYTYGDLGTIFPRETTGESELHPVLIGAWGEGDKPVIDSHLLAHQNESSNVVLQGIELSEGARLIFAKNWIFDDVTFTGSDMVLSDTSGITLYNSSFYDIHRDEPALGGEWHAHTDRISALYAQNSDGLLIDGSFADHIAWVDGYETGEYQPPSMFSHNFYIQSTVTDLTVRDTITMQASSFGIMARSGGYFEDNVFLDNNAALDIYGGDYNDAGPVGNYSLLSGNLVTSAGHKIAPWTGAISYGLFDRSVMTTWVDNIVAHLADPNNEQELLEKTIVHAPVHQENAPYYDDTIIYRWDAEGQDRVPDQNTEGLDSDVLDQTTIQLFTAALLGDDNATISDLADYLRAQYGGTADGTVDADLIIDFFREGFGLGVDLRATETTLQFVPDDLGDGVRWDNRMNWDTDDLPGTQDGDSVDLNGNEVVYGGTTVLDKMDLGDGGALRVPHGKLTLENGIDAGPDGGQISIDGAGQVWTEGYVGDGVLDVDVDGGRFANTGHMTNTDVTATGGQTILAADNAEFELSASRTLSVFDAAAKVGFDGEESGIALLDLEEGSTVQFGGSALGTIEEFRSGALGEAPDVQSGINLGDSTLEIDLNNLSTDVGNVLTLMDSDELIGMFDEATSSVGGLGDRDATIVIDYEADIVRLELSAGSGNVSFQTVGVETDVSEGEDALWAALTAEQGIAADELPDPDALEEALIDAA